MGNFNIKIELDRIPGAKIMDIKGDVATRRCIVIPIDNERGTVIDNERGTVIDEYKKFDPGLGAMTSRPLEHVQLLATAYESANQSFGSSHYIKPQVSREYFERMSETQVRGLPFIGSLQPWKTAPKKEEVKDEDNW